MKATTFGFDQKNTNLTLNLQECLEDNFNQENSIYLLLQFHHWKLLYVILFCSSKAAFEMPNVPLRNDVVVTHIYSYLFTSMSPSPAVQCNLPSGQTPSVSVIYTGNTNVELNQFNDFEEGEQYHCNLLCQ